MENSKNRTNYIPWRDGDRVTGKYQMEPKDYGEHLARSGKNKHNTIRRKQLTKIS